MMDRKPYQDAALDTLTRFARRAAEIGPQRAFAASDSAETAKGRSIAQQIQDGLRGSAVRLGLGRSGA